MSELAFRPQGSYQFAEFIPRILANSDNPLQVRPNDSGKIRPRICLTAAETDKIIGSYQFSSASFTSFLENASEHENIWIRHIVVRDRVAAVRRADNDHNTSRRPGRQLGLECQHYARSFVNTR